MGFLSFSSLLLFGWRVKNQADLQNVVAITSSETLLKKNGIGISRTRPCS